MMMDQTGPVFPKSIPSPCKVTCTGVRAVEDVRMIVLFILNFELIVASSVSGR